MKLTWTVMAVLPTPPSPRTVILKSIRAEGPFLFSFRYLTSRQKSAIVFSFLRLKDVDVDVGMWTGTKGLTIFWRLEITGERETRVGVGVG